MLSTMRDKKSWFCHLLALKIRLRNLITCCPGISSMKVTGNPLHPIFWDSTVFIRTKGMVNTFNREFVYYTTHMKAESKATYVYTTIQVILACYSWDNIFNIKGFEVICAGRKITLVLQRRAWSFLKDVYLFEWEKKSSQDLEWWNDWNKTELC